MDEHDEMITAMRGDELFQPPWHIPGCTGQCLACLIEKTILKEYGTQGLDYLRRKVEGKP